MFMKTNVCKRLETYRAKYKGKNVHCNVWRNGIRGDYNIIDADRVSDLVREGNIWISF